uniref:Tudor domain-containing protein n=1 Tax=Naja naja TaxID=35670 RepID=A0A8C6XZQ5_NAJNA
AVTFWAQNINKSQEILKISCDLAEICPEGIPVYGNPDFSKIYGGCFSDDGCWYRCKVTKVVNHEEYQVLYIDYGNSEVLRRPDIVEISENFQFPGVAKKYKLWGLQVPANADFNKYYQVSQMLHVIMFVHVNFKCKPWLIVVARMWRKMRMYKIAKKPTALGLLLV